LAKITTIMVK